MAEFEVAPKVLIAQALCTTADISQAGLIEKSSLNLTKSLKNPCLKSHSSELLYLVRKMISSEFINHVKHNILFLKDLK